ncbi:MAG: 6-bladed beta-propeller [Hydrogenophaga sp.]|nr:6-bladed beta-propeller [Hydrogenophaga sp.]
MHEATLRSAASVNSDSDGALMRRLLTGEDPSQNTFSKPMGVAAHRGRVFVTDTEGRRVFVFDVPRRKTFQFGFRREGTLKMPAGIAVDGHGAVYVVDSSARRLVVYDGLGLYLRHIAGDDWVHPSAVAVNPDGSRLYVVDTGRVDSESHRVHVYDAGGRRLAVIGRRGEGPGEFNLPTDAAVAPDGTLWVLDAGNFRVQAFEQNGNPLRRFGSVGSGLGQFARPRGLAVDAQGLVYVSDAGFCNVQVFQPGGELLLAIGSRGDQDVPGRFRLPSKLACDERGYLYVVDQYFHKVEVIRRLPDGA